MILTRDKSHGDYEIHSYEPGKIQVNDQYFTQSLVISSHQLELWQPQKLQELVANNFDSVLALHPDVVLLGTGETLVFPESKLLKDFYAKQIGVEVMNTLAACRTFNVLMSEGRNVVAALIIR